MILIIILLMSHLLFLISDELQVGPRYNLRDRSSIDPADKYGFSHVNAIVDEPSTYQEASRIPEWQLAMSEELFLSIMCLQSCNWPTFSLKHKLESNIDFT